MTSIKNEKRALIQAISAWRQAEEGGEACHVWATVEDAILALDNAAYDRAYAKAHESGTLLRLMTERDEAYARGQAAAQQEIERLTARNRGLQASRQDWQKASAARRGHSDRLHKDIKHLTMERDQALQWAGEIAMERDEERGRTTVMTLANDDKRQEIRRLEQELAAVTDDRETLESELADACDEIERLRGTEQSAEIWRMQQTVQELSLDRGRLQAERDKVRAESVTLIAALGRIEVLTRRGMNDDDLLPVLKRAQSEAWKAYRDAQVTVLPIGEDMPEVADEEKGNLRLLRQIVSALVQREGVLEKELAEARDTIKQLQAGAHAAGYRAGTISRLRKALEALADRYHARTCNRWPFPHPRQDCQAKPKPVQDAEKALAGESEEVKAPLGAVADAYSYGSFDDRKPQEEPEKVVTVQCANCGRRAGFVLRPKAGIPREDVLELVDVDGRACRGCGARLVPEVPEEPEIEAVLMGDSIACACKCGAVVQRGQCAYRLSQPFFYKNTSAESPLYASKECARKAARSEKEEPDITDIDVLRACRGFHERGDGSPFGTLAGDFSATVITAKMQAMVARGLLKYDTNLSIAWATVEGARMLRAAEKEKRQP